MVIRFTKISDERHAMEIERADGTRERAELETRSLLLHDFLHYVTEAAAGLENGFWGSLAAGKTLVEMDDRSGESMKDVPGIMLVEMAVGAITGAAKGRAPREVVEGARSWIAAQGLALPEWLDERMVGDAMERLRRINGMWKATPYGRTMELAWPAR